MSHKELFGIFAGSGKRKHLDTQEEEENVIPPKVQSKEETKAPAEEKKEDAMQALEEDTQKKNPAKEANLSSSDEDLDQNALQPEFTVLTSTIEGCQHECVIPINYNRKGIILFLINRA